MNQACGQQDMQEAFPGRSNTSRTGRIASRAGRKLPAWPSSDGPRLMIRIVDSHASLKTIERHDIHFAVIPIVQDCTAKISVVFQACTM